MPPADRARASPTRRGSSIPKVMYAMYEDHPMRTGNPFGKVQPRANFSGGGGHLGQRFLDGIGVDAAHDPRVLRVLHPQQQTSGAKISEGRAGPQKIKRAKKIARNAPAWRWPLREAGDAFPAVVF